MTKGEKHHGKSHHDVKDGRGHDEHMHHILRHKRAKGGAVKDMEIDGVPEIGGHPEKPMDLKDQSGRKRGGRMHGKKHEKHEKRKRGGKVHGKHPGHRLDKRARGGRMTPKSPFSGADAPDLDYAKADVPMGSEGKGKQKEWD